ncbi:MAG: ABC transporter ATP-binding protein [Bradymonadaceae bacterium]|nr:ABC transporter ATP-binding protein [Lujinxingiaceae bacterium]
MNTVHLRSLSRSYGRLFALHRVTTSLHAGSITAILGGNGAGKTTLINILATLDSPTAGEVLYDACSWSHFARRHRARIGWVSHDSLLYDELSGRENLQFYARMYGLKHPEEIAQRWLERVGMNEAADRRVATYSRGMRQRLTVARALIHEPSLVLFDEPTSGLDQQGINEVGALLAELREAGRIVVLITHDFHVLDANIDRLLILKRGKLTFDEDAHSSAEILDAYAKFA